ncbi:DUF1640 domain-containing protein (plasmid) [Methylocapsa polymorpha]|uniref:DUF1640 domain-containing protein n=1 Tax=Methylocapsa polymorpha TaxID=3080828 RepID=A0ABZ0I0Y5_9HYPH|nr:DUF1640 domain-containing protein [Methylocapsa sp. RX1]
MTAILFDTLRVSRTLRDKGHFTPEQAESLAEALGEATQGDLATKADLAAVKAELKNDIAELRTELKGDIAALRTELKSDNSALRTELKGEIGELRTKIAETKTDILKWIIGAIGFQTIVILGALVSLAKLFAK